MTEIDPFLVQTPQQARSRETMERILDAATELLETQTFEQLTVAEIVARAGCSVGAFYGRFRDKEALLHALDERFLADFVAEAEDVLTPDRWADAPMVDIIEALLSFLVEAYGAHRGLLRALNVHARLSSGRPDEARWRDREHQAWRMLPDIEALLLAHREEITHPQPQLAVRIGFLQAFYALREMLLWDTPQPRLGNPRPPTDDVPHTKGRRQREQAISPETLVAELTRAYLAYLGASESHTSHEGGAG